MRNRSYQIQSLTNNATAPHTLWHLYPVNLDNFKKFHEYSYQLAIVQIASKLSGYYHYVHNFFKRYVEKNPQVSDAVDVAFENLEITKNFTTHINSA